MWLNFATLRKANLADTTTRGKLPGLSVAELRHLIKGNLADT